MSQPPARAARRYTLTVYAVLALASFAFPGGLVDWLDERNASGWLNAPLALMRGVDRISTATGVEPIGRALRKRFAALIGQEDG